MGCLKCGRETQQAQVFCPVCQEAMQKYPVKPGTVIHLPQRDATPVEKPLPAEQWEERPSDQLPKLRRLTRWLTATIALLSILLCIATGMLVHTLNMNAAASTIGRNYTTAQEKTNP